MIKAMVSFQSRSLARVRLVLRSVKRKQDTAMTDFNVTTYGQQIAGAMNSFSFSIVNVHYLPFFFFLLLSFWDIGQPI